MKADARVHQSHNSLSLLRPIHCGLLSLSLYLHRPLSRFFSPFLSLSLFPSFFSSQLLFCIQCDPENTPILQILHFHVNNYNNISNLFGVHGGHIISGGGEHVAWRSQGYSMFIPASSSFIFTLGAQSFSPQNERDSYFRHRFRFFFIYVRSSEILFQRPKNWILICFFKFVQYFDSYLFVV